MKIKTVREFKALIASIPEQYDDYKMGYDLEEVTGYYIDDDRKVFWLDDSRE